jgi:hypothetical protein
VASALAYLHSLGIAHGDVYAHNIMPDGHSRPVICDFGASFCYSVAGDPGRFFERMEVRAFGLFMGDVVARIGAESHHYRHVTHSSHSNIGAESGSGSSSSNGGEAGAVGVDAAADYAVQELRQLVQQCLAGSAMQRPLFAQVEQQLLGLMQQHGVAVPTAGM